MSPGALISRAFDLPEATRDFAGLVEWWRGGGSKTPSQPAPSLDFVRCGLLRYCKSSCRSRTSGRESPAGRQPVRRLARPRRSKNGTNHRAAATPTGDAEQARLSEGAAWPRAREPSPQFDEISPKFIAANRLFRLEDRAIANACAAVLKSAKRQISARILRKRCPVSDLESSHFQRSIASHETSSETRPACREAAGIWLKTVAPSMPRAT